MVWGCATASKCNTTRALFSTVDMQSLSASGPCQHPQVYCLGCFGQRVNNCLRWFKARYPYALHTRRCCERCTVGELEPSETGLQTRNWNRVACMLPWCAHVDSSSNRSQLGREQCLQIRNVWVIRIFFTCSSEPMWNIIVVTVLYITSPDTTVYLYLKVLLK